MKAKKLSTIFLSLAFVMIFAMTLLVGCSISPSDKTTKEILGIAVVGEVQTEYLLNENFNTNGAKIEITYDDQSTVQISLDKSMTNFDSTTIGSKDLTITYKEKVATLSYRVDKFRLGRYYYYYEGLASEYEYSKESKNENFYLDIKGDKTASLNQLDVVWEYSERAGEEGLSIRFPNDETVFVKIVSTKCLKIISGENDSWIQILRID